MDRESLIVALKWIHVGAGALWIGAAACFAVASSALDSDSVEQRDFAARGGAVLGRIAGLAAALVIAAGVGNLAIVFRARAGDLPRQFITIVAIKFAIFLAMAIALGIAIRAGSSARRIIASAGGGSISGVMRLMVRAHAACALMGAAELMLGLWLAGI
jgi:hypothetical protein